MPGQLTNAKIEAVRASFVRNAPQNPGDGDLWMYQVDLVQKVEKKGEPAKIQQRTVWPFAHNKQEALERAFTQIGETDLRDHHGWRITRCRRV